MTMPTQSPVDKRIPAQSRRRWLVGAVAGVAAVGGFSLAWRVFQSTGSLQAVEPNFWQHQFVMPDGETLHMNSFRHKPLLLNFWATWCPPCIEELPLLSSFYKEKLANGWQVLGLAVDEPDPVRRFLARSPVTFPVAMAGTSGVDISRYLGNSLGGLPFTVVLDSQGQIVHRKMGRVAADELRSWTV